MFTNGSDPTFESWRIEMRAKLRANDDHYPDEEDKMEYIFSRTLGDARKHLVARFDEDSFERFTSATEMFQHLASIYVNPNKVRDARYDYQRLMMRSGQSYADFRTQFLHLAGEAQIPSESLRMDLYDKLTVQLQERLAVNLRTLDTFTELSASCLALDTELKRIAARVDRRKGRKEDKKAPATSISSPVLSTPTKSTVSMDRKPSPVAHTEPLDAPRTNTSRHSTPKETGSITCYNCQKVGHAALACPERKQNELKEIEEYSADDESGKELP
jgi:hypothetical protein